jgi:hypothetical protein
MIGGLPTILSWFHKERTMEFGFSLPSRGPAATMQNLRLLAQDAEALGVDSVWVSDHIIVPQRLDSFYPYDPQGRFPSAPEQAYFEPLTALTFLAGCTNRVQLGTSVLILPYRNAILTAKIGSLVISGVHNSMIFWTNKAYPYKSSWILWNKCVTFNIP